MERNIFNTIDMLIGNSKNFYQIEEEIVPLKRFKKCWDKQQ